jgi:dihydropteroate synthase
VINYALESGFEIVNDITGLTNDEVCSICSAYDATVVIMHMQGTPQTMQNNPTYGDLLDEVYCFLAQRVEKAQSFGINNIMVDVGIGFGKTLQDNITLIRNLEHFVTLGKPLLVGASRKSMIDKIFPSDVSQRLSGTLALHLEAARNGASVLRVHDVYEHKQALAVQEALIRL